MKWISHQIVAFSMVYSVTGEPLPSLIASASTTLPDVIESGFGKIFFKKHRGLSHNPVLWIILIALLYNYRGKWFPEIPITLSKLLDIDSITLTTAIASGILLHLFADFLSSYGIPLWGERRIAMKLYKTFTFSEFIMVLGILLACSITYGLRRLIL